MPSDWVTSRITDIAKVNPPRSATKGSSVPFIDMAALPCFGRDIPSEGMSVRPFGGSGSRFQRGDTLVARITPCLENGKTALVSCIPDGITAQGSTEFVVLSPKTASDELFLYYLAISPAFREYAIQRMEGTSGRQRVSGSSIGDFEFECPPPEERKSVGLALGALDDRVASLRGISATLEQISMAIFKSWFIDFEPVRAKAEGREPEGMSADIAALFPSEFVDSELGPIPKGWSASTLSEAFEINPSRRLPKGTVAPYLDMSSVPTSGHCPSGTIQREVGSGSKFINGDTLLAKITPCLENGKTAHVDFLRDQEVGWGSTEFIVLRPKSPLPAYLGYLLARNENFRQFAIQAMTGTSGRQRVDVGQLARYPLVVPDAAACSALDALIDPLRLRISHGVAQAATLASLRDAVLPRLLSRGL